MGKKMIIENEYIHEEEFTEIDSDLNEELKIDWDDWDEITRVDNRNEFFWTGDSYPIKIDKVLKLLNKLKTKHKCKYVEIMYHDDHIGYYFTGLNIHKHLEGSKGYKKHAAIDEEEIEQRKQEKIKELETELEELKNK